MSCVENNKPQNYINALKSGDEKEIEKYKVSHLCELILSFNDLELLKIFNRQKLATNSCYICYNYVITHDIYNCFDYVLSINEEYNYRNLAYDLKYMSNKDSKIVSMLLNDEFDYKLSNDQKNILQEDNFNISYKEYKKKCNIWDTYEIFNI